MNTLAWLLALPACLWLAVYSFGTLDVPAFGYIGLGLFMFCFVMAIASAFEDVHSMKGGRGGEEE
jgi:hypothetical protein